MRERLLDATILSILEDGFSGATTRRIGQRAGVSRGAQLHHYPTRQHLLGAAAEHLLNRRHQEFQLAQAGGLTSAAAIAAAVEFLWSIYSGPTLKVWQELVIAARTDAALREQLAGVNERFFARARQTLADLFGRPAVDDDELAAITRLTLAILDGLALNQTLEPDERGARNVLRLVETLAAAWSEQLRRT